MSKPAAIIDAPGEIENLTVNFNYNFFVPDESINENVSSTPLINKLLDNKTNVSLQNVIRERKYERYIPRYNILQWTPISIGRREDLINSVSITNNIDRVLDEEKLAGKHFTSIVFKDNGTDGKVNFSIVRAMEEILKSQGIKNPNELQKSPLDLVKLLNKYTSQEIQGNFLAESFINLKNLGVDFVDRPKLDVAVQKISNRLQSVKLKSSVNNMFLGTTLKSATQESDNIYGDETYSLLPGAIDIQQKTIAQNPSYNINADDYVIDILGNYIEAEYDLASAGSFIYQSIGYIINKTEYPAAGPPVVKPPIIIESPKIGSYVDMNVKYGTRYGYTIKMVYLVKLPAMEKDTGKYVLATFLISTQESPETYVDCREFRPPNPPRDFKLSWDYELNKLRITWSFPVDSQRDIKYFQVFKRNTINEPYELVKMYDFNDSITPYSIKQLPEYNISEKVVENLRNPDGTATAKNYFLDPDFTKESKAIYTLCAIDAHGLSSNYGMQLEVSFDKFKNNIVVKLISVAGAPKAYPNFFLQKDTFVDSIRTNGASKLSIYFNPEYLKVVDRAGTDLRLIKTEGNGSYKLQMINVDLQKYNDVDINIENRNTSINQILPSGMTLIANVSAIKR